MNKKNEVILAAISSRSEGAYKYMRRSDKEKETKKNEFFCSRLFNYKCRLIFLNYL